MTVSIELTTLTSIAEHLGYALQNMDQIGALQSAAHVDLALQTFKAEARQIALDYVAQIDFSELDKMIEKQYYSLESV